MCHPIDNIYLENDRIEGMMNMKQKKKKKKTYKVSSSESSPNSLGIDPLK